MPSGCRMQGRVHLLRSAPHPRGAFVRVRVHAGGLVFTPLSSPFLEIVFGVGKRARRADIPVPILQACIADKQQRGQQVVVLVQVRACGTRKGAEEGRGCRPPRPQPRGSLHHVPVAPPLCRGLASILSVIGSGACALRACATSPYTSFRLSPSPLLAGAGA